MTTPNSAKRMTSWPSSPTRPSAERADHRARDQVAEDGPEPQTLGHRHGDHRRGEVDERLKEEALAVHLVPQDSAQVRGQALVLAGPIEVDAVVAQSLDEAPVLARPRA